MALAETNSFLQPSTYFTLADPAMPISPTYVADGYPLCEPFVNHGPFGQGLVLQNIILSFLTHTSLCLVPWSGWLQGHM